MQLGVTWGLANADEWARATNLRPAWTKLAADIETDEGVWVAAREATMCAGAGIRPVIDLRCNIDYFAEMAPSYEWHWADRQWNNPYLFAAWMGRVRKMTNAAGDCCRDWEVWGEAPCRWTGQSFWHPGRYANFLAQTGAAIRDVQPEARVWIGGHGVNGDVMFWREVEELASDAYDVNNLHCFFHDREWETIEGLMRSMFATVRGTEKQRHALGSTEFGWPTHPDGAGIQFNSHLQASVASVSEEQGAAWLDESLRLFEQHGMDEVCVVGLRDGPPGTTHWGRHLGLYRHDWTPKPMLDVWKTWNDRW